jgi:poly(3-hydroxyalkanoate) synthetase
MANAVSPSNFLLTNPELMRDTLSEKRENLVRGMTMLAEGHRGGSGLSQAAPVGCLEIRGGQKSRDHARQGDPSRTT